MPSADPTIYLVDDDERLRAALVRLLRTLGHAVVDFNSAEAFLAAAPHGPGCLLLDVRMPQRSGLELQAEMARHGLTQPIVFLTGHGDIAMSVQALRAGAEDFLTKPVSRVALSSAIKRALLRDAQQRDVAAARAARAQRLARLSPREREVACLLVEGQLNKQVAFALGTTERTIKAHRASIMHKLALRSLAELVRLWDGVAGAEAPSDASGSPGAQPPG
ncbi:MAG: response regulator [Hydrogenophaga sp.]|nr:response regulator [Hydrogenophaga sp.]